MIFTTSENKLLQNFKLYEDPIQSNKHQMMEQTFPTHFTLQNKYINFLFHIFSHTFYETKQGGEREREILTDDGDRPEFGYVQVREWRVQ